MTFQPSEALEFALSPEGMEKIHTMLTQGKTLKQVADALGTTLNTLYVWRKKYPELAQIFDSSRKVADEMVEQSLYESCFGHTEKEITIEKDGDGNITRQVVKTKYIPASTQAITFWLSNRQKDAWKSSRTEISTPTGTQINFICDIPNPYAKDDDKADMDAKVLESYKQLKKGKE